MDKVQKHNSFNSCGKLEITATTNLTSAPNKRTSTYYSTIKEIQICNTIYIPKTIQLRHMDCGTVHKVSPLAKGIDSKQWGR
jgi:hypothetical protein